MISRRSFLKISGLAAVALGAGYGVGKVTNVQDAKHFSVQGFIPGDESVVKDLVKAFNKKINTPARPVIYAESQWSGVIAHAYKNSFKNGNSSGEGQVTFRLTKINGEVNSDILLSDDKNAIYNPSNHFDNRFTSLRKRIQNQKAGYLFSAEYSESNMLASLFKSNERIVVIENEKGVVDKIKADRTFKNIEVTGTQGKTGIALENGLVHVHTVSCRHGLCKHTGFASNVGDVIACAPNKVLIKIESV